MTEFVALAERHVCHFQLSRPNRQKLLLWLEDAKARVLHFPIRSRAVSLIMARIAASRSRAATRSTGALRRSSKRLAVSRSTLIRGVMPIFDILGIFLRPRPDARAGRSAFLGGVEGPAAKPYHPSRGVCAGMASPLYRVASEDDLGDAAFCTGRGMVLTPNLRIHSPVEPGASPWSSSASIAFRISSVRGPYGSKWRANSYRIPASGSRSRWENDRPFDNTSERGEFPSRKQSSTGLRRGRMMIPVPRRIVMVFAG